MIQIREATIMDLDAIVKIEKSCFLLGDRYSRRKMAERITGKNYEDIAEEEKYRKIEEAKSKKRIQKWKPTKYIFDPVTNTYIVNTKKANPLSRGITSIREYFSGSSKPTSKPYESNKKSNIALNNVFQNSDQDTAPALEDTYRYFDALGDNLFYSEDQIHLNNDKIPINEEKDKKQEINVDSNITNSLQIIPKVNDPNNTSKDNLENIVNKDNTDKSTNDDTKNNSIVKADNNPNNTHIDYTEDDAKSWNAFVKQFNTGIGFFANNRIVTGLQTTFLSNTYSRKYFVAEEIKNSGKSKIVGYGEVAIQDNQMTLSNQLDPVKKIIPELDQKVVAIVSIGVLPNTQGKGIGSKILEAHHEYLKNNNIKQVFAHAWPNGGFPKLGPKNGFELIQGWVGRKFSDNSIQTLYYKILE